MKELTYNKKGGYLFPDLRLEDANLPIGKYGLLRKNYLKEHKRGWYSSLLLTDKLDEHLAEIDRACSEHVELITNQLARREGVTEALKAPDQMEWVRRMNNLCKAKNCLFGLFLAPHYTKPKITILSYPFPSSEKTGARL